MPFDVTPAAAKRRQSRLPGVAAPRTSNVGVAPTSVPATPVATPPARTPRRSRLSNIVYSPPDTGPSSPSLSAPPPFDWEAARNNAPPPFGTPNGGSSRGSRLGKDTLGASGSTPRKRVFRKPGFVERLKSLPSRIAFELSMFPHNVPMPPPTTTGQLIGGLMHITHMSIKWAGRSTAVPKDDPDYMWKSELGLEFGADENESRWSWTTPITFFLFITSVLNVLYMFTRIRTYQLQYRNELVKSAHASIVSKETRPPPSAPKSIPVRILLLLWQILKTSWRMAFGHSPRPEELIPVDLQPGANKVQQLEVWNPGEVESALLVVYSPAHFFVWRIFSSQNWFSSFILLGLLSFQLRALMLSYEGLVKDRSILSAEVLHEYDTKFVNPRLHGLKRDFGTQTNEAEMADSPYRRTNDQWRTW